MKKYIISLPSDDVWNAASKARDDVEVLAVERGFECLAFRGEKTSDGSIGSIAQLIKTTFSNWSQLEKKIEPGSTVLMQYPHYPVKTSLIMRYLIPRIRRRKGTRFIAVVHDLNSVRGTFGWAARYSDQHLLKQFDTIICHNDSMKQYLVSLGFDPDRLVSLEIFDYLTDDPIRSRCLPDGIALAGNLSPEKCGYIKDMLGDLNGRIAIHLYGNGFEPEDEYSTITHHGAFPPSELPGILEGAFGLVWDGTSTDSCIGLYGDYLRINNPHKVSLYLASGLPVIIWDQAALADFIVENGLGITVRRLDDIPTRLCSISCEEYEQMLKNVSRMCAKLRRGHFFNTALNC